MRPMRTTNVAGARDAGAGLQPRLAVIGLLVVAFGALVSSASAEQTFVRTGPEPAWIAMAAPLDDADTSSDATPHGRRTLLYDRQIRVEKGRERAYLHVVERIANESGLESASQLRVDFDPSYETLTVHSVVVRRAGEVYNRLDRHGFHVAERETNLESQVVDGRLSAVLFLQDLRVGDVVDYAYSIDGSDPTVQGRFANAFVLGGPEPIGHIYARALLPEGRNVHFALRGPTPQAGEWAPVVRVLNHEVEYVWDLSHVPAYSSEKDTPSDYEAYPWIQISDFESWQEVARLGAQLFDVPIPHSGPLWTWVQRERSESATSDEFMLRAIRFVQDEVRYVAIEVGVSRRRPADPAKVFDRRYGDCKDKTALLIALLRAGGIEACPALVNTTRGRSLDRRVPSLKEFDHSIVAAAGSSGRLWIDPTLVLQGGGLDRLKYSGFERALVLDPQQTKLEELAREPASQPLLWVRDTFNVGMPGTVEETTLDSEREYRDSEADTMRVALRSRSREQIRNSYLELLQAEFASIRNAAPLDVDDDRAGGRLRVVAHFAVPGFWTNPSATARYRSEFPARVIDLALPRPHEESRTAPFGLLYPSHTRYQVRAELPFDLTITPENVTVDDPAFLFRFTSAWRERTLSYTYEVSTRTHVVEPKDFGRYLAAADRARKNLERTVLYRPPPPDGPNWPIIAFLVLLVPVFAAGAYRAYRYNPGPSPATDPAPSPDADPTRVAFGGWLGLLGLGLLCGPFVKMWYAGSAFKLLSSAASWTSLTTSEFLAYSPFRAGCLVYEAAGLMALTAYNCALVKMFFRRRRSLPMHFTVYSVAMLAFYGVDVLCGSVLPKGADARLSGSEMAAMAISSAFWIAYLRLSRRAAAAFVE